MGDIDATQHGSGNMSYTFEGVEAGGTQLAFIETAILHGKEWWKHMVQTVDTVVVTYLWTVLCSHDFRTLF